MSGDESAAREFFLRNSPETALRALQSWRAEKSPLISDADATRLDLLRQAKREPEPDVYFVLSGLLNGEDGVLARDIRGNDMKCGWYFTQDDGETPDGPYGSREEVMRQFREYYAPEVTILGRRMRRMNSRDRQPFLDAGPRCYIYEDETTTIIWDAEAEALEEYPKTLDGTELCYRWERTKILG